MLPSTNRVDLSKVSKKKIWIYHKYFYFCMTEMIITTLQKRRLYEPL